MIEFQKREDAIFAAALPMPAEPRASYLQETCGGDTELRRRVETRLAAATATVTATSTSAETADALTIDDNTLGTTLSTGGTLNRIPEEGPGDAIGRYTLVEVIGEGGCGLVYLAEQKEPVKRQVALKITKLGMDTKQVVIRFEAERQALALMDHPHIASVIDGGATATGRPFFVMELVRGVRITDYCDEHKLSTRARLHLFIQVCQAIEHAHEKGVIHRDIKPSNILVEEHEGVATCKVIDFGIAKATQGTLTDKTIHTQVDQFLGTPAYMSPEQVAMSGQEPDARSDIYSLGVLLYELLTGYTPFESKGLLARGFDEMRRIIVEMEPLRPSNRLGKQEADAQTNTAHQHGTDVPKLINIIRGDLDWIVMKCLEKDRARRYDSANELTADLTRFLANEPILARPPSRVYRFRKLVLRNRWAFGVGAAFFAAMTAGLCVTTWYVFKEYDEQQRAERAEASAVTARDTAVRARDEAMLDREDAEAARMKAETALRLSETNRLKAEASDKTATLSKQSEEVASKKAENAEQLAEQERKELEAARAADAEEMRLRRLAEEERDIALRTRVQSPASVSNILAGLDALPPAEAIHAAAVFFQTEDESQRAAMPLLRHRGEWRARAGDLTNAVADFAKVLSMDPGDVAAFTAAAALLANLGQRDLYQRVCADFLARAARPRSALLSEASALSCLLLPVSGAVPPAVAAACGTPSQDPPPRPLALALLEYRQNRFAEAMAVATKAISIAADEPSKNVAASAVLALAQQQSGKTDDARATLDRARQADAAHSTNAPGGDWRDWTIAKTLLQEAVNMVAPPLSNKSSAATQ